MKNLPSLLAAGFVVLVMLFYMCTFQIGFTEVAIKETFGDASQAALTEPGLQFKWPWPIQNVVKFDKRVNVLEDRTEETITADSKNVILTTSAFWTIEDPYLFHRGFDRFEDGEKQLRDAIRSQKKAIVGQYNFANFVSTHSEERKLVEIEQKIVDGVRDVWRSKHGVHIKYFGITKLALPQSVTEAIFESMKKNEQNKADNYIAEGEAQAQQIVASANAARQRIMAVAERKADEFRNEGDRVVSELYALFEEAPELRIYLDKLNALEASLSNDATIILDRNIQPFELLSEDGQSPVTDGGLDVIGAGREMAGKK